MVEVSGPVSGRHILAELLRQLACTRVQVAKLLQGLLRRAIIRLYHEATIATPSSIDLLNVQLVERGEQCTSHGWRKLHVDEVPKVHHHVELRIGCPAGHLQTHSAVGPKVPGLHGAVHSHGRLPGGLWCGALGHSTHSQPARLLRTCHQYSEVAHLIQSSSQNLAQSELGIKGQLQGWHVGQAFIKRGGVVRDQTIEEVVNPLPHEVVKDGRPIAVILGDRLPSVLRSHGRRDALLRLQLLLQLRVQLAHERLRSCKPLDGPWKQRFVHLVEERDPVVQERRQGGLQGSLGLRHEAQRCRETGKLHLQVRDLRRRLEDAGEAGLRGHQKLGQGV
mmetsp:Transcript_6378/g.14705  ORF Transcript_6378/g.14705 Transcript_6378/m.14705 type:complete len:335 (-) Transcript_6378:1348-2352(-)